MLAAFIDESYLHSEDVFVLGCVLADGESLASLVRALDAVVHSAASYGIDSSAELHAHEMFHGKGEWRALSGKARAQVALYREAFRGIRNSGVRVLTRATTPSKLNVAKPHALTLRYLIEEIDRIAAADNEHVLVICDHVDESSTYCDELRTQKVSGSGGYKSRRPTRILDTMHFADSRDSRGLQAADLVAFLRRRQIRNRTVRVHPRETKAISDVWDELRPCIIAEREWPQ